MFTYQSQERILKTKVKAKIKFPSKFEIKLELGPKEIFGNKNSSKQNFFINGKRNISHYNANNGRHYFISKPPLQPLQDRFIWDTDYDVKISGNIFIISGTIGDWNYFINLLEIFHYIFPTILNVNYPETPFVIRTSGSIGNIDFGWELMQQTLLWLKESEENLKTEIQKSFLDLLIFDNGLNRRVGAGLKYYYNACRLIDSGNGPNEFMAEVILNLAKSISVLFPGGDGSRDIIRHHLTQLDYTEDEIETKFIPLLLLRNHFDVGHAFLSLISQEDLKLLYEYLKNIKEDFRELFHRIIERLIKKTYEIDQVESLELDNDKKRTWENLKISFKKRLKDSSQNSIKEIEKVVLVIK